MRLFSLLMNYSLPTVHPALMINILQLKSSPLTVQNILQVVKQVNSSPLTVHPVLKVAILVNSSDVTVRIVLQVAIGNESCLESQRVFPSSSKSCLKICLEGELTSSNNGACLAYCPAGSLIVIDNDLSIRCPGYSSASGCFMKMFCRRIYRTQKWVNSCEISSYK